MCMCVCKPLKQMVGDVRLRQTIDFRKQISSLVKQKAPLGPSEGRRERGREGVTECACLTSAMANCREIERARKRETNKRMKEGKREKLQLMNSITAAGERREQKRGEEESGGGRGEDNGVNAGRQAAVVLGLITHTLSSSGEGSRWEACI